MSWIHKRYRQLLPITPMPSHLHAIVTALQFIEYLIKAMLPVH